MPQFSLIILMGMSECCEALSNLSMTFFYVFNVSFSQLLTIPKFPSVLFVKKLLRSLDLFVISLESCFVMKGI